MPSIGKDLQKIREHLGHSIEDVQHYTKIPADTLRRIENDDIFEDSDENLTYVRSFVRSYGRALKISDDLMIKALDQFETGNYNHLLLQQFPELSKPSTDRAGESQMTVSDQTSKEEAKDVSADDEVEVENDPDTETEEVTEEKDDLTSEKDKSGLSAAIKEPETEDSKERPEVEKPVRSVDWADVGRKFTDEKKKRPVWIIALIIIVVLLAGLGYFLYQRGFLDFTDTSQPENVPVNTTETPQESDLNLSLPEDTEPAAEEEMAALDDTLFVTVYAATDRLDPVRVWSDIKPRLDPYWLEQGTAMRFEFQDTIRIRGPYERMLLFKDGHRINNPDANYYSETNDYVEITRSLFTGEQKWATSIPYELPEGIPAPDSVTNRPTFP